MSDCSIQYALNIHRSGVLTVLFWLLHGWCHLKLLPSPCVLCTPYNHVYTIQPCTMSRHFEQSHVHRVHVCLAVTCHSTFGRMTGIFHVLCNGTSDTVHPQQFWTGRQGRRKKTRKKKKTKEEEKAEEAEVSALFATLQVLTLSLSGAPQLSSVALATALPVK